MFTEGENGGAELQTQTPRPGSSPVGLVDFFVSLAYHCQAWPFCSQVKVFQGNKASKGRGHLRSGFLLETVKLASFLWGFMQGFLT